MTDILIVGAGAAGLMAAKELSGKGKSVLIIEACDRIGGRIHTISEPAFRHSSELGAEFIHGNLTTTLELLKEAGIPYYKTGGHMFRFDGRSLHQEKGFIENYDDLIKKLKALKKDASIATFMHTRLEEEKYRATRDTLKSYIEGYYAASIDKANAFALRDELLYADDEQYRVEGGYGPLVDYLWNEALQHGCGLHLSSNVTNIQWHPQEVRVTAGEQTFRGRRVLITVPLGIWQKEEGAEGYIQFTPTIDEKYNAATSLGFGGVIKVLLYFKEAFWKTKGAKDAGFLFSKEEVPTWWTQHPNDIPLLTGWIAGPNAKKLSSYSEEVIVQKSLQSLAHIFSSEENDLRQGLERSYVANWVKDSFSNGAYSYDVVNGAHYRKLLKAPLDNTIYVAGEALIDGPEIGTVEAALRSGKEAAQLIIQAMAS